MTGARTNTLASLRGSIERIEAHADATTLARVALGHADADATLQGGLAVAAVHEVFAEAGRQSAAATGFIAGLAGSPGPRQVDQIDRVFVRQENALKPGLAIERRLVCPGAGAVDKHHRMPARSARDEPLGEAVIAGLEIGRIVGHRHGGASECSCAHALYLDDFFGSGPALRKCARAGRDGQ